MRTRSVDMEFHYAEDFGAAALPEAYERLLLDAMQGDASLFARADEIELAWRIVDPILAGWAASDAPPLTLYEPGSWGPTRGGRVAGPGRPRLAHRLWGTWFMTGAMLSMHGRRCER